MIAEPLRSTLEETGYLINGGPAANTVSIAGGTPAHRLRSLRPDAWWRSGPAHEFGGDFGAANLTVLFKFTESADDPVAEWQLEAWNLGCAPLLWVVSPDCIDVYNGFGKPRPSAARRENRLRTFDHTSEDRARLNEYAGRLAMETGLFWRAVPGVDQRTRVDRLLLEDLGRLEGDLVKTGLGHQEAQGLIGRTVFAKYLIDRKIVTDQRLQNVCGHRDLAEVLDDREATKRLFAWLRATFNGDMFPETLSAPPEASHLSRVASFLRAEGPAGQMSLFPYRFDVIPVELISSIYERFVHSSADAGGEAELETQDVYYTPLTAVSMVLDEVFDGLTGDETVIDLTCGSGVFLVEALRRLVRLKANGGTPTREMVRHALYEQIYGVDISEPAIQIAAFSLYLAALELDPDPTEPRSRGFEPLVGRTLLAGDAHAIEKTVDGGRVLTTEAGLRSFDIVVGNPPWSYKGSAGTAARHATITGSRLSPRGESLDFVRRACDFAHAKTRFGVLVSATPFFARSKTGLQAAQSTVESLLPLTLVDLSALSHWLFDKTGMPAMALISGRPEQQQGGSMQLVHVPRSPEGTRSRTIGAVPGDVVQLRMGSWKRNRDLLKTGFMGSQHDLLLMDRLWDRCQPLKEQLQALGTQASAGAKRGNLSGETGHLKGEGLPFLDSGRLGRFAVPRNLPEFDWNRAEHPRTREIYRSPLVLVKESIGRLEGGLQDGRPVVAVAERDIVYKDTYFGVSLHGKKPDTAHLLAGILSSALASWYFLMAGSSFGTWKRIIRLGDVKALPAPDLELAMNTDAGARVVRLVRRFHDKPPHDGDWRALDEAVFDLYQFDREDRIVVADGQIRATWQWQPGWRAAAEGAEPRHLDDYARAFLLSMDAWLHAANKRRFRAEIHDTGQASPLRVVRFVLEDHHPPSQVVTPPQVPLADLLRDIDRRLGVSIARELVGARGLRVHAPREVVIVKPAARRFWLGVAGLDDARAVLVKSFGGGEA